MKAQRPVAQGQVIDVWSTRLVKDGAQGLVKDEVPLLLEPVRKRVERSHSLRTVVQPSSRAPLRGCSKNMVLPKELQQSALLKQVVRGSSKAVSGVQARQYVAPWCSPTPVLPDTIHRGAALLRFSPIR